MKRLLHCLIDSACDWYAYVDYDEPKQIADASAVRREHHAVHSASPTTAEDRVAGGAVRAAASVESGPAVDATTHGSGERSSFLEAQTAGGPAARTNITSNPFPSTDRRAGFLAGPGAAVLPSPTPGGAPTGDSDGERKRAVAVAAPYAAELWRCALCRFYRERPHLPGPPPARLRADRQLARAG